MGILGKLTVGMVVAIIGVQAIGSYSHYKEEATLTPEQREEKQQQAKAERAKVTEENRINELDRTGVKCKDTKKKGYSYIGETTARTIKCGWGKPDHINRTTYASGVREQWVYGGGNYLYFTDGVLTAMQN